LGFLSYQLLGKSGAVKKKNQDPAPAPLSVKKDLVVATPKVDRNARKRKQKDEETSGDDETDEEAPSSELSDDEGGAEATDEFATVIRGPPTVTDGEDIAGKNQIYCYDLIIYACL
jgi:hypothetical protein